MPKIGWYEPIAYNIQEEPPPYESIYMQSVPILKYL